MISLTDNMCGGFNFSKNALVLLNLIYMVVGLLLIGVATYGKTASIVTSVTLLGGIVFCGCVLLATSALGLVGALRHHQVLLFFYMLVLFLLFVIQFSIACACLGVNEAQQVHLVKSGWGLADNGTKRDAQNSFGCCGFYSANNSLFVNDTSMQHPACPIQCCPKQANVTQCCMDGGECLCSPCEDPLVEAVSSAVGVAGGIGLFFSFMEMIGFVVAYRYRHMMDPVRGMPI